MQRAMVERDPPGPWQLDSAPSMGCLRLGGSRVSRHPQGQASVFLDWDLLVDFKLRFVLSPFLLFMGVPAVAEHGAPGVHLPPSV